MHEIGQHIVTPDRRYSKLKRPATEIGILPETRRRLESMGLELTQMSPEQFAAYVRAESVRYGKLLRDFGINKL